MSGDDESVSFWLANLKDGDEAAVQHIWERYFTRLVALARRTLADSPRFSGIEEDVAQSAFKSFYIRARDGKFPCLDDRDDLWKLLLTITLRKSWRQRRRESKGFAADPHDLDAQVVSRLPDPGMAAIAAEEFRRLFGKLDKPLLSRVALMKLEGFSNRQIGKTLNVSLATIERKLRVIRHLWGEES